MQGSWRAMDGVFVWLQQPHFLSGLRCMLFFIHNEMKFAHTVYIDVHEEQDQHPQPLYPVTM